MKTQLRKKINFIFLSLLLAALFVALFLTGCAMGSGGDSKDSVSVRDHSTDISSQLSYVSTDDLHFAKYFSIDRYEEGYALITIEKDSQLLVVPEGKSVPDDLNKSIITIEQPVDDIYLVASSVMDMFVSMDGMSSLKYTATKAADWYIDEAKAALENGQISYAGKYSAPDYEQLLNGGCHLAIENTMIFHSPQIREQLENIGIPVMVDYSSYEDDPMGRCEWVKLYGCIAGREDNALAAYNTQESNYLDFKGESSGKTVAFFYITNDGQVSVRKSSDYIPAMIKMAGGDYIFSDLGTDDEGASSTVCMTMEEFYASAKDCDYIIYNSSIDGEIHSISDLVAKSELLNNFKAVKEGQVFCTSKNMYQSSMEMGTITKDIHSMLAGVDDEMVFMYRVK